MSNRDNPQNLHWGDFSGIPVVSETTGVVVDWVLREAVSRTHSGRHIHLVSGHGLIETLHNSEFEQVLQKADLVIPDGRWLEILTRSSKAPLHQLRGTDLLERVIQAGSRIGIRHFFLTSNREVLSRISEKVESAVGGAAVVGGEPYPFGKISAEEKDSLVARIQSSGADIVWIGISTPRQDMEAVWLAKQTGLLVVCVGAAAEYVSGTRNPAPRWIQRLGLEWLYRLFREPRRLWRRYGPGSALFLRLVFRHFVMKRRIGSPRPSPQGQC